MNEFDAYLWLALCTFILIAELYFPYRILLFSSFFISSGICLLISLISKNLSAQAALFIVLSFFAFVTIKFLSKTKGKGKRGNCQKGIALSEIKTENTGYVYFYGKVIEIHNSSADAIERGEVVTIVKD